MNARIKLNSVHLLGRLSLAAIAGGVTRSWSVFLLATLVLVALSLHDGGIRLSGRKKSDG